MKLTPEQLDQMPLVEEDHFGQHACVPEEVLGANAIISRETGENLFLFGHRGDGTPIYQSGPYRFEADSSLSPGKLHWYVLFMSERSADLVAEGLESLTYAAIEASVHAVRDQGMRVKRWWSDERNRKRIFG